ncbi:nuclear speckle splicing regulatory protein 1 isoform X1 [Monodelphis domestica]|uniref:nuclear speckle splicing regulatory protein 1 isoform X1 n=2 Tax=Monodelphis domestica TaxID=13616 RepID=UPI0024E23C3F|nr:nuclear speckle splicing regulatory protein 1 isoform X1 [Monodelphis domestica]
MAAPSRQYGLIFPKKAQQLQKPILQKPSVFDNDSDEETSVSDSIQREACKKQMMKQTKLEIQKALAEDATVYEYDSIYDDMQRKKEENNPKLLLVKDRKPKYIHSLLKAVEIRKKEQEKRMEKKIQKEREMEKGEFDDKEAFVTSAYKKKLQERAEEAERERRAAALEARLDVTKQKDLSGFYRHLLNQAVGEEEVPECSLREASSRIKEEKPRGYSDELNPDHRVPANRVVPKTRVKDENPDADSDLDVDSSEDDDKTEDKSRWSHRKESGHQSERSQAHSSSSGEDRGHQSRSHTKSSRTVTRERGDQHQDRSHESHIREPDRRPESGHHKEKPDQHRSREDSNKDHVHKRREQEDRERRERRMDREHRQEEEREKQPSKGRERARLRNSEEPRDEARGETRDRSKGHAEGKRNGQEKCREKEPSTRPLEQAQEREGSCSGSGAQDRLGGEEGSSRGGASERAPSPKGSQESKRQPEVGGEEKPPETLSKFAKRSNKETVMSARDRYLARQMARVSAKTYIEKEED